MSGADATPDRSTSGDLPPPLGSLVEEVIEAADLPEASARRARADLREHFCDGLERGRTVDELVRLFGDPGDAARLLSRHPAPAAWADDGSGGFLRSVIDDVRHAFRSLLKSPGVAVTSAIVLAVGLGANTVVFTALNELLLRPVPVSDPASLVDVWADIPGDNSFAGFAYGDFESYRERNRVLDELAAFMGRRLEQGEGADPRRVTAQFVSPEYFSILGLRASLGSMSFADHSSYGDEPVAVLSHAFWSEAYGADASAVGRTIRLEGRAVIVVGVGPRDFTGHFIGFPVDVWLPLTSAERLLEGFDLDDRASKDLEMIGRLRPGVTAAVAASGLNAIAAEIERRHPELNRGHRVGVTRTTGLDHSLHATVRTFVTILTVVSVLVLLIACLNVGGVLLVRAMARDRELAVRVALGAGRVRLVRHLVTESTLLVLLGSALGVGVALRSNRAVGELLRSTSAGIALDLVVDWRVLALTGLAALAAALLATVAPALHVLRRSPAGVLRARRGDGSRSARLRSTLVVSQVAISVVLVIATGLFVRALAAGARVDPGFDADAIATLPLSLPEADGAVARAETAREVVRAVSALPSIDAVAVASAPPIGVRRTPRRLVVPGVVPPPDADHHVVDVRWVGPGYLDVLGIGLLSGRGITGSDEGGAPVAVVSAAFQRRFGRSASSIGNTIEVADRDVRVVGVAADARYVVQDDTPDPLVYLSDGADASTLAFLTVRAKNPAAAAGDVHQAVSRIVPGHRRAQLRTGREVLDSALLPQRLGAVLVGAMGVAAIFLAAVGLYGLVQFTVARDTPELGVRLALGGGRRELLLVVLRKGASLALVGTAIGVAAALILAPGLEGFLSGVSPADPLTYGLVIVCFVVVAVVASWLPARRAMRIDAMEALRSE